MITELKQNSLVKSGERMNKVSLFLDSGAYSAFTKGISIDIQEYIKFIKENIEYLTIYANLDCIGDAEASLKNQKIMEEAGLHPIPCYHMNEEEKYLRYYLDNYEYIALGGMVGASKKDLGPWLDWCWDKICTAPSYLPTHKVHAFGMTSHDLMVRYPWYSVDSTSWVMTGRFGAVYVPKKKSGRYDYLQNPMKINISNRSPKNEEEGQHYSTLSLMEQKEIFEYFKFKGFDIGESIFHEENPKTYKLKENERWFGKELADAQRDYVEAGLGYMPISGWTKNGLVEEITIPGLCNDYRQRDELNIIYFLDLEDNMPKWPWPFKIKKAEGFGFR